MYGYLSEVVVIKLDAILTDLRTYGDEAVRRFRRMGELPRYLITRLTGHILTQR